jgi:hypothetical protein
MLEVILPTLLPTATLLGIDTLTQLGVLFSSSVFPVCAHTDLRTHTARS